MTDAFIPNSIAPVIMFSLWQSFGITSVAVSEYIPVQSSTVTTSNPSYNLSETVAFKMLKREPVYSGTVKEIKDLQDLEDSRLAACEEKGIFWEQCFVFGENDGERRGPKDAMSPAGSRNHHSDRSTKVPTW